MVSQETGQDRCKLKLCSSLYASSRVASCMPPTVFWPDDEQVPGFCYGWTQPVLCVAGVLQELLSQEAENTLASLDNNSDWTRLSSFCGGKPVILGKCSFNQGNGREHPLLELNGLPAA
ncbi:hypothetical protein B0H12DRAFT_483784 [Mycena haematopus]|nr:hypothetical protein B0H12DRAFT_483784 [Mycena haematopus]